MTVFTGDANLQPPTSVRRVRFASRLKNAVSQRIVFDGTHTPIKTFLFIVICAAWILPGLTGHAVLPAAHFSMLLSASAARETCQFLKTGRFHDGQQ